MYVLTTLKSSLELMKKYLLYVFAVLASVMLAGCKKEYDAKGKISGKDVQFMVDSKLAKLILENEHHLEVQLFFKKYQNKTLNTKTLTEISKHYSADVSALYFLHRIYLDSLNEASFQKFNYLSYHENSQSLKKRIEKLQKYYFVFVPGFFYKTFQFSGADFYKQRAYFDKFGIKYNFIETGETDSTTKNAVLIQNNLKKIIKDYDNIIIISASKGGLEVINALGDQNTDLDMSHIKAWISVCGILRGCPVKAVYDTFPYNLIGPFLVWINNINPKYYLDIDYGKRLKQYDKLELPPHLTILHYLGVPMHSTINDEISFRYKMLQKFGANDGSCPLADQLTPQGIVIADPGLDHYLKDSMILEKTISLCEIAIDRIQEIQKNN